MGWILVQDPNGIPRRVEIPASGSLVCGRSRHADLVLEGGTISRRHVVFYHRQGADWVEDAGSKNGSILNGDAIQEATRLAEGDTVNLGSHLLVYSVAEPDQARPAPAEEREQPEPEATPLSDTGRWRGVSLVGRGGMGEVYCAYDHALDSTVAIKRLRRGRRSQNRILRRLHAREAAIGRTLEHPNVVRVLEDGLYRGDPYMLLEWVDGVSLDELKGGVPELSTKVEFLRQIALGLEAAHDGGVVHADLKPANVMIVAEPDEAAAQNLDMLEAGDSPLDTGAPDDTLDGGLGFEIAARAGIPEVPDLDKLPFVAREAELALLEQMAREASGDAEMRWVLVLGERGAGKRRLVREFLEATDRDAVGIKVIEDFSAPPLDADGLWISILPPAIPDDAAFRRAYERSKVIGVSAELFLKPFLRGQSIQLIESVVKHPPSARAFIDAVEQETGGNPQKILDRLRGAFELGAWARSGAGYRFLSERFTPDETAVGRAQLERLQDEEKGLRDLLSLVAPLGSCLDFEIMMAASGQESARLFYVVEHAVKSGYFRSDDGKHYEFTNEPFRHALEKPLGERERLDVIRRSLPVVEAKLGGDGAPARIYIDAAGLEREAGRPERAFRWYVEGALAARARYDRRLFLECVDDARDCYRRMGEARSGKREFGVMLEELLGSAGRGLGGIDRLRKLPTAVRVKIADFGISRTFDADDEPASGDELPWGTPRYMSPEQVRREPLTPASDIFSLGILARELLEGSHPLGDRRGKAALNAILSGSITAPTEGKNGLPPEITSLVGDMLELDADQRPGAREVAQRMQAAQLRMSVTESRL